MKTLLLIAVGLMTFAVALATTFINRPLGEVVKETPLIVRGRAGESYSDWDKAGRGALFTYTPFAVSEVLRGELKETKILLRQPGGSKDGTELAVPGVAHFNQEEDVVVFLGDRNKDDDSYDVPGFATGKYNIAKGENGEPVMVNSLGGGAIYDPQKDPRTMSYNASVPLEVFKRIAKGEDIPEAAHRQFKQSDKPAPKGTFESEHDHRPKPAVPPQPAPQTVEQPRQEEAPPASPSTPWWIPLSFALFVLAAGYIFWRTVLKKP